MEFGASLTCLYSRTNCAGISQLTERCPPKAKVRSSNLSRARHDFNDLAGFAKEPLIAAEAPRKHSTGSNRTVCRTPVGNELASDELRTWGRAAPTGGQYDCAQNIRRLA